MPLSTPAVLMQHKKGLTKKVICFINLLARMLYLTEQIWRPLKPSESRAFVK